MDHISNGAHGVIVYRGYMPWGLWAMGAQGVWGTWAIGAQGVWATRGMGNGYRGMGNGTQGVWGTRGMGNGSHGQ